MYVCVCVCVCVRVCVCVCVCVRACAPLHSEQAGTDGVDHIPSAHHHFPISIGTSVNVVITFQFPWPAELQGRQINPHPRRVDPLGDSHNGSPWRVRQPSAPSSLQTLRRTASMGESLTSLLRDPTLDC